MNYTNYLLNENVIDTSSLKTNKSWLVDLGLKLLGFILTCFGIIFIFTLLPETLFIDTSRRQYIHLQQKMKHEK